MANPGKNLTGELTTIRDILMGEQMVEYDARFRQMEENIKALENQMKEALADLERRQSDALEKLRGEAMARLDALEKLLEGRAGALEEKIDAVSASDRVHMGRLLQEMGRQLEGDGIASGE